jgi:hypothetical protein
VAAEFEERGRGVLDAIETAETGGLWHCVGFCSNFLFVEWDEMIVIEDGKGREE